MQFRLNNDLAGIYYILFISSEKTGRTVASTMIFVICLIWVAVHYCRCDGLYLVNRGILHIKNVIQQYGPITEKRDLHIEETHPIVEDGLLA